MIIRILSDGQYEVAESAVDRLNALDDTVHAAVNAGDEAAFRGALTALVEAVRTEGQRIEDQEIVASDAILPPADATLEETRDLLQDDGLIPG